MFWKFIFPPFFTKNSTKWLQIQISKSYIFWVDGHISIFFSLLTSLRWLLSEIIIRYPIIIKTKFGGNFVTWFSRQKYRNLKNKNTYIFFGMVSSILLQNFKWIALKTKGWIKVGVSDVTYAHRAESVFAMLLVNLEL